MDPLILTRHQSDTRFDPRIDKLSKQCGEDGHGTYKSTWFAKNKGDKTINMNPKIHTCDYSDVCRHNEYKANDVLQLVHTKDVALNWGLKAKAKIPYNAPLGLCNGEFRRQRDGDEEYLQHAIFMTADDVEYETLYDCSDPNNIQRAKASDKFVLDFGDESNGGMVKYINTTCVENRVNAKLYRVKMDGQWNAEYYSKRFIEKGEYILDSYGLEIDSVEVDDNAGVDEETKRYRKYKGCMCYKLGIKECVNSPRDSTKSQRKKRRNKSKIKSKNCKTVTEVHL